MSTALAQLKHLFGWHCHPQDRDADSGNLEMEAFGSKVRRAYREGKLHDQIQKAEIDYAEGRALDTLY